MNNTLKNTFINVDSGLVRQAILNIIKTEKFTGKLIGLKGQYLIFEDGTVFNVRSNEGVVVNITVN